MERTGERTLLRVRQQRAGRDRVLAAAEAARYTPSRVLDGWLRRSGAPCYLSSSISRHPAEIPDLHRHQFTGEMPELARDSAPSGASRARRRRRVRHGAATLLAVAALAGTPAHAQSAAARHPDLSFLGAADAPSRAELEAIERGDVVVRSLRTADRDEVALLGLVNIAAPRDFYFERARNLSVALSQAGRQAFGVLHSPARASDLAPLKLDPSDASGLRKCQVLRCSIKLPAQQMAAMSNALESTREGSSESTARVDSFLRDWLVSLVTDYRARGDAALPVYDDTRAGESSAAGYRQILAENAPMLRDAPAFAAYLAASPDHPPAGAASTLYWAADRRPGLKPIVSVNQLSTFRGADANGRMFIATKQLYATHYFDAWLDLASLVEQQEPMPHTTLVLVRRVRFDHLPSRGLFDLRGRVVRKLRDAMREELGRAKQTTEAAHHAP